MKKVLSMVCVLAFLLCAIPVGTASAHGPRTEVEAVRWFPADANRLYDDIWEVECVKDGCLCQRFTDIPEETGNTNFLDTVYNENGGLTITRNGADGSDFYWPRIRTLWLENYPALDIKTANTLFFDIEARDATWNVYMSFNGMGIKLGRAMAESTGVTVEGTMGSEDDAPAGRYIGSINLIDALTAISESYDYNSTAATAILNLRKTFVPQIQIFCVGGIGASVTINKLYLTTADDVSGAKTEHVDIGMVMGDIFYGESDEEIVPGDVNNDGKIDIADATMVFRFANGRIPLGNQEYVTANVNGDDKVDIADATMLFRYANGRINSFDQL